MTIENKEPSSFDALMSEMGVLAKAMPEVAPELTDEEKAAKAQADAAALEAAGKEPMVKSLQVTLADGTVVDAEDGTELVKSLMDQVSGLEGVMAKALGQAVGLIKRQGEQIASHGDLVKSLQTKVAELSGEGRGRKALLSIAEKPTQLAKSEPQGMTPQDFMVKANTAFSGGKITGQELTVIDVSIRQGQAIDTGLVSKVMA